MSKDQRDRGECERAPQTNVPTEESEKSGGDETRGEGRHRRQGRRCGGEVIDDAHRSLAESQKEIEERKEKKEAAGKAGKPSSPDTKK